METVYEGGAFPILIHLSPTQWLLAALAALLVGFSKTGIPGAGILVVPLMAAIFGGRFSVGALLPMLIFADIFAISWYRAHALWDKIRELLPSVIVGMIAGTALLWKLGESKGAKDLLNPIIGGLVLVMLGVTLIRKRLGDRFRPDSKASVLYTGGIAGFSTTVSNAGGPVMSIYMTSLELPKDKFMGTSAWYFFLINSCKLPIYLVLTRLQPGKPFVTGTSLQFDLIACPVIVLGVYVGKWLLPHIQQKHFDFLVLSLAAIAAVKLLFS